jgi:uncharacterized alpha-E superfamily protein
VLSRVADACFWLSRYMERAEASARIMDVNIQFLLDFEDQNGATAQQHWEPILATLEDQERFGELHEGITGDAVMDFVTFEKTNPNSILFCVADARENARMVREQISSEMWEQLNRLYLYIHSQAAKSAFLESPIDFYRSLVDSLHSFQGITDATMTHGEGWQFLQAGKFLERADSTSRVLDIKYHILLPTGELVGGTADTTQWMAVLRSCSAMEAFLKISHGQVTGCGVAEFLILHDRFPRSIRFCVDSLDLALHSISGCGRAHFANEAERLSGMLRSDLDYTKIQTIFGAGLHQYLDQTQLRLIGISEALVNTYCSWLEPTPASPR